MRKPVRFYLAHAVGKGLVFGMRLLKRNATYLPGKIALRIDPKYLAHVDKPGTIIAVTGTNGKTTAANMIGDHLKLAGETYMHNSLGSNTLDGIASSFLGFGTISGAMPYTYGVLEIDERSAIRIFGQMRPTYMVVTNLFRDSYARNAHTDYILSILAKATPDSVKLVLNTEDLVSWQLKPGNDRVGFSVPLLEGEVEDRHSRIRDLVNCPLCHHPLEAEFIRYNHIGRYTCPACGFHSPEPDYRVEEASLAEGYAVISSKNANARFQLSTRNIVDVYNLLSAVAVLHEIGFSLEQLAEQSRRISVVASRFADVDVNGTRILSVLSKASNPIASSRTFDFVRKEPGKKAIILANSDKKAGDHNLENVAWIYDNDFSYLKDPSIRQIVCCGKRYLDFAFCLALAGVEEEKITLEEDFTKVSSVLRYGEVDTIVILKDLDTMKVAEQMSAEIARKLKPEAV